MKTMNRNQWIGVASGLVLVAFLLFGGQFLNLFSMNEPIMNTNTDMNSPSTGYEQKDIVVGTGEIAAAGDKVTLNYVGKFTNGTVFDSSVAHNKPIDFTLGLGQVIRGWDEGIVGMRVGGKRILTISPDFGYGPNDYGPIPGGSTLIFEVELLGVQKPVK